MTPNSTQEWVEKLQFADEVFVRLIPAIDGIRQVVQLLEAVAQQQQRPPVAPTVQRPERLQHSKVLLDDLTNWADGITAGITGVIDQALLTPEADFLWEVSPDILNRYGRRHNADDAPYQRLSSVLLLEALIASPAAVQNALQMLRSLLLEEDPKVAALRTALDGRHTPSP